jgi:hydrogenase maturation protease
MAANPSPGQAQGTPRVLVACFGNALRSDDGFGPAVAKLLSQEGVPEHVRVLDVGIGGMQMVHELAESHELLVVVDALDLGRAAGTVLVIDPDVGDLMAQPFWARRAELGDAHHTVPDRALRFARAVGVLPARTWLVGCQPDDAEALGLDLSPAVERAVPVAAGEVRRLIAEWTEGAEGRR